MNKLLNTLLWVGIGVIIGATLFSTCKSEVEIPIIVPTKEIKKEVAKVEANYKIKYDSLLVKELVLKSKEVNLTAKLKNEIASRKQAELLLNTALNILPDTVRIEVEKQVSDYQISVDKAENTCTDLVDNLTQQNLVKDSMLIVKDSLYSAIKHNIDLSLIQTDKVLDYSKQLKKEIKRKKAGAFVWKAVSIGLAGVLIQQSLK